MSDKAKESRRDVNGSDDESLDHLPCDHLHQDDGVDPRVFFDRRQDPTDTWRQDQLCACVADVCRQVLNETEDPALANLDVFQVVSLDRARLLEVFFIWSGADDRFDEELSRDRLAAIKGWLRSAVASQINRKYTPDLKLSVVPPLRGELDRPDRP